MQLNKFQELALRTKASATKEVQERLHLVFRLVIVQLLIARQLGRQVDNLKRFVFYGDDKQTPHILRMFNEVHHLIPHDLTEPVAECKWVLDLNADAEVLEVLVDIIHSWMGLTTEGAGELGEAVLEMISDEVPEIETIANIREELGDVGWYTALGADAIGEDLDGVFGRIIDKLQKRYPDKFNEHDAVNRDLEAEQEVLRSDPPKEYEEHRDPPTQEEKPPMELTTADDGLILPPEDKIKIGTQFYSPDPKTGDTMFWIIVGYEPSGPRFKEGWVAVPYEEGKARVMPGMHTRFTPEEILEALEEENF